MAQKQHHQQQFALFAAATAGIFSTLFSKSSSQEERKRHASRKSCDASIGVTSSTGGNCVAAACAPRLALSLSRENCSARDPSRKSSTTYNSASHDDDEQLRLAASGHASKPNKRQSSSCNNISTTLLQQLQNRSTNCEAAAKRMSVATDDVFLTPDWEFTKNRKRDSKTPNRSTTRRSTTLDFLPAVSYVGDSFVSNPADEKSEIITSLGGAEGGGERDRKQGGRNKYAATTTNDNHSGDCGVDNTSGNDVPTLQQQFYSRRASSIITIPGRRRQQSCGDGRNSVLLSAPGGSSSTSYVQRVRSRRKSSVVSINNNNNKTVSFIDNSNNNSAAATKNSSSKLLLARTLSLSTPELSSSSTLADDGDDYALLSENDDINSVSSASLTATAAARTNDDQDVESGRLFSSLHEREASHCWNQDNNNNNYSKHIQQQQPQPNRVFQQQTVPATSSLLSSTTTTTAAAVSSSLIPQHHHQQQQYMHAADVISCAVYPSSHAHANSSNVAGNLHETQQQQQQQPPARGRSRRHCFVRSAEGDEKVRDEEGQDEDDYHRTADDNGDDNNNHNIAHSGRRIVSEPQQEQQQQQHFMQQQQQQTRRTQSLGRLRLRCVPEDNNAADHPYYAHGRRDNDDGDGGGVVEHLAPPASSSSSIFCVKNNFTNTLPSSSRNISTATRGRRQLSQPPPQRQQRIVTVEPEDCIVCQRMNSKKQQQQQQQQQSRARLPKRSATTNSIAMQPINATTSRSSVSPNRTPTNTLPPKPRKTTTTTQTTPTKTTTAAVAASFFKPSVRNSNNSATIASYHSLTNNTNNRSYSTVQEQQQLHAPPPTTTALSNFAFSTLPRNNSNVVGVRSSAATSNASTTTNCTQRYCAQCNLCQQEAQNAAVLVDAQTRLSQLQLQIEMLNKQIQVISEAATSAAAAAATTAAAVQAQQLNNNNNTPTNKTPSSSSSTTAVAAAVVDETAARATVPPAIEKNCYAHAPFVLAEKSAVVRKTAESDTLASRSMPLLLSSNTSTCSNIKSSNITADMPQALLLLPPSPPPPLSLLPSSSIFTGTEKQRPRAAAAAARSSITSASSSSSAVNNSKIRGGIMDIDEICSADQNLDAATQTSDTSVAAAIDAMQFFNTMTCNNNNNNDRRASIDSITTLCNNERSGGGNIRIEETQCQAPLCRRTTLNLIMPLERKREDIQQLLNIMRVLYDKISSKAVRATQMVRTSGKPVDNARVVAAQVLSILDDSFDDAETVGIAERLKAILTMPNIAALFHCHDVIYEQIVLNQPPQDNAPPPAPPPSSQQPDSAHSTLVSSSSATAQQQQNHHYHQRAPATMLPPAIMPSLMHANITHTVDVHMPPPPPPPAVQQQQFSPVKSQTNTSAAAAAAGTFLPTPASSVGLGHGNNNASNNIIDQSTTQLSDGSIVGGTNNNNDDARFSTIRSQGRHGQFYRSMDNIAVVPPQDVEALASGMEPPGHQHAHAHHQHHNTMQNHSSSHSNNVNHQNRAGSGAAASAGGGGGVLRMVQLTRTTDEPMGITLRMLPTAAGGGGADSIKCFVARILHGGLIHRADVLHVGDEIREINNIKVTQQNIEAMQKLLREARGNVSFKIAPVLSSGGALAAASPPVAPPETYVRAQFTYDPQRDDLIPCADAGLQFNTGDILQVIDREDPDWWQARKIGPLPHPPPETSETSLPSSADSASAGNNNKLNNGGTDTLNKQRQQQQQQQLSASFVITGLIPSPELIEYQQKRLVLEKSGKPVVNANNNNNDNEDRNVHCSILRRQSGGSGSVKRKNQQQQQRKNQNQNAPGGGGGGGGPDQQQQQQPKRLWETLAASLLPDQFEVLSYEEVIRLPFYERKTLVLLGAHGVGRRHIKNCLISAHPDKFAYPVPHTTRPARRDEQNGRNYHFVTQKQMMSDIAQNEYLEYGTHEGNMYGTKLDSIRAIHKQSKIAVLDVEPQALKILRCQEYAPFVVFIAAPTLNIPDRDGSSQRLHRESDLLRKIYGHLFDMTIINNDIDQTIGILDMAMHDIHQRSQWVPIQWIY